MRARILLVVALAAACASRTEAPDEVATAEGALAVVAAAGLGPWMEAKWTANLCTANGAASIYCVNNVNDATAVLDTFTFQGGNAETSGLLPFGINFGDGGGTNPRTDEFPLSALIRTNVADKVSASFSGYLKVPQGNGSAPNEWTFSVGSDDGYRLRIHNGTALSTSERVTPRSFAFNDTWDKALTVAFPSAGMMAPFELVWFDSGGSAGVEFVARAGKHTRYEAAQAASWSVVPKTGMYAPNLKVTTTVEKVGAGAVASGDTVRWTTILRNLGQTPIYPVQGGVFPGNVTSTAIVATNCVTPAAPFVAFDPAAAGLTLQTTLVSCPSTRVHMAFTQPILPGASVQASYRTTVTGAPGAVICDQITAAGSTTEIDDLGELRAFRISDDPSLSDGVDGANAPTQLEATGAADDDTTCVTIGQILPGTAITTPANAATVQARRATVSGTARPAGMVQLVLTGPAGATQNYNVVANVQGLWSANPTIDMIDGAWTAAANIYDVAGGVGPTSTVTFTVNATPPAAPTLLALATPSKENRPLFSGTARQGELVTVVAGNLVKVAVCTSLAVPASGTWSCQPALALSDGASTATASATDALSRTGPDSAVIAFVIDTVGPTVTITAPTGVIALEKPVFSGACETGATVRVRRGATELCSVVGSGGSWSCTSGSFLPQGSNDVTAAATDAAGNDGVPATRTFQIDTLAPAKPVLVTPPGVLATGKPVLTGQAEAGSTVRVRLVVGGVRGAVVCSGLAAVTAGAWTCTPGTALADGLHALEAEAEDAAGNISAACAPLETCTNEGTVTIDAAAPAAPMLDTFPTPTRAAPAIVGSAETNARVKVRENATVFCDVTALAGRFSCPARVFAEGAHTIEAQAIDAAQNASTESVLTFEIDTIAPGKPVLTAVPAGTSTRPALSGTGTPGSLVRLRRNGITVCETTVAGNGTFTCTPATAFAEGVNAIDAIASDPAGNVSAPATVVNVVVDTIAPAPPALTAVPTPSQQSRPVLAGSAEAGATVTISEGATVVCETTGEVDGTFSCEPPADFAGGLHTLTATARDAVGNRSAASPAMTFTVDALPPGTPTLAGLPALTRERKPLLTGHAEAGSQVRVLQGSVTICAAQTDDLQNYACRPPAPLADGTYTLRAVSRDSAGNDSTPSNTVTFTIDSTPPAPPTVDSPATVSNVDPTVFSGHAEPGTTVVVEEDGAVVCVDDKLTPEGLYSCSPEHSLASGPHETTIYARDPAKNESTRTVHAWRLDVTAPPLPEIDSPEAGQELQELTAISGRAREAATVQVVLDGEILGLATVENDTFTLPIGSVLGTGPHTVTARSTDAAGNRSRATDTISFAIVDEVTLIGGGCQSGATGSSGLLTASSLVVLALLRRRSRRAC